ncbi:UDP-N-acetylglucosamine 2-epimerase [Halobacteroides halobius DSM 5150]|uniref:UDP-N-acetylglucosamine 2-epimerase (non-hydrolyzing) n=1 Tax=Halobacteroides halobius (strain ATCC 35273 / DSM 5150 / MD-1) TaxID=748449 RepID=L0KCG4_HALHC|nr:UDP-N-acetylglucosamine 2-epimerase (non-hydrolyzing) [Halobacteroides halobius]AGB42240.1 UDP-N-acetylglucosamine 2-epimerase [Halobacteroides halobius DSM 5150]
MKQLKIMSIFGTRPEAIKMAPVIKVLEEDHRIKSLVTVTGQHRSLLDQVLELFSLNPDYDLQIMESGQSLAQITTKILSNLEDVISQEEPDLVLVHGDTSTTFVSALTSFYQQLKIGHIEAGLRSGNKYAPYPEEINRRLTGVLADLHFTPSATNRSNLLAEGIPDANIFLTGNTVIDALEMMVEPTYQFQDSTLQQLDFPNKKIILVTAHRRENLGQPLVNICRAVEDVVALSSEVEVVWPLHPNPKIKDKVYDSLANLSRVHLIKPLPYQEFINLIARSYLVVTDSGGLQEEAPSLDKPVLVLRETTERSAALQAGTIELVGTQQEGIRAGILKLLTNQRKYETMANTPNPYGDGQASQRIVEAILYSWGYHAIRPTEFEPLII